MTSTRHAPFFDRQKGFKLMLCSMRGLLAFTRLAFTRQFLCWWYNTALRYHVRMLEVKAHKIPSLLAYLCSATHTIGEVFFCASNDWIVPAARTESSWALWNALRWQSLIWIIFFVGIVYHGDASLDSFYGQQAVYRVSLGNFVSRSTSQSLAQQSDRRWTVMLLICNI